MNTLNKTRSPFAVYSGQKRIHIFFDNKNSKMQSQVFATSEQEARKIIKENHPETNWVYKGIKS